MDNFTIHITGTQTHDDGTVDVIDETLEGVYMFAIAGTVEQTETGEAHKGNVSMRGEWGFGELAETFLQILRATDHDPRASAAMLYAIREREKERAGKAQEAAL